MKKVCQSSQNFAEKLASMLQVRNFQQKNQGFQNIIKMDKHSKFIQILDENSFKSQVLPYFFNHSRLESFFRQLNYYGFKKIRNTKNPTFINRNLQKGVRVCELKTKRNNFLEAKRKKYLAKKKKLQKLNQKNFQKIERISHLSIVKDEQAANLKEQNLQVNNKELKQQCIESEYQHQGLQNQNVQNLWFPQQFFQWSLSYPNFYYAINNSVVLPYTFQ